jgi:hypothetical protein
MEADAIRFPDDGELAIARSRSRLAARAGLRAAPACAFSRVTATATAGARAAEPLLSCAPAPMIGGDQGAEPRRDGHRGDEADAAHERRDDLHRDDLAVGDRAEALTRQGEQDEQRERGARVRQRERVHRRRDVVAPDP